MIRAMARPDSIHLSHNMATLRKFARKMETTLEGIGGAFFGEITLKVKVYEGKITHIENTVNESSKA